MEGYGLYLEISAWSTVTWTGEMDISRWNCAYTVVFREQCSQMVSGREVHRYPSYIIVFLKAVLPNKSYSG